MPNTKTPILTNCNKLDDGATICKDASPVINKVLNNPNGLEPLTDASNFYKFGELVFDPATIYEAASKALENLKKGFNFDNPTSEALNQWVLFNGMIIIALESNSFIHPDSCMLSA